MLLVSGSLACSVACRVCGTGVRQVSKGSLHECAWLSMAAPQAAWPPASRQLRPGHRCVCYACIRSCKIMQYVLATLTSSECDLVPCLCSTTSKSLQAQSCPGCPGCPGATDPLAAPRRGCAARPDLSQAGQQRRRWQHAYCSMSPAPGSRGTTQHSCAVRVFAHAARWARQAAAASSSLSQRLAGAVQRPSLCSDTHTHSPEPGMMNAQRGCGKKRKQADSGDAERNLYGSFVHAANAVSQLYTAGLQAAKKAEEAGARRALVRREALPRGPAACPASGGCGRGACKRSRQPGRAGSKLPLPSHPSLQERVAQFVVKEYGNAPAVPTAVLMEVLRQELQVRPPAGKRPRCAPAGLPTARCPACPAACCFGTDCCVVSSLQPCRGPFHSLSPVSRTPRLSLSLLRRRRRAAQQPSSFPSRCRCCPRATLRAAMHTAMMSTSCLPGSPRRVPASAAHPAATPSARPKGRVRAPASCPRSSSSSSSSSSRCRLPQRRSSSSSSSRRTQPRSRRRCTSTCWRKCSSSSSSSSSSQAASCLAASLVSPSNKPSEEAPGAPPGSRR